MIANQVTINPERKARYLFSTPYTYSHGVIVTAKGTDDITTLADLKGRTTAQSSSSNWAAGRASDAGAKVQYVQDFGPGVALLAQGRVDAIVNDNIAVLDYLATSGTKEVKIAGDAGDEVLQAGAGLPQGRPRLRQQADDALAGARQGRHPREDLRRGTSAPTSRSRRPPAGRRRPRARTRDAPRGGRAGHGLADVARRC